MKIRKGNISDFDSLFRFLNETPELQAGEEGNTYTKEWVNAVLTDTERDLVLIAEENNKIIGFLMAELWPKKGYSFFSDIFVVPEFRRKGVATKLLGEYEKIVRHQKMNRIMSWVLTNNKKMHNFMKNNGFKKEYSFYLYEKK